MGKIKVTSKSAEWTEIELESMEADEWNDCTVKAFAMACNVTYSEAHSALKAAGRERRMGTRHGDELKAIKALGFKLIGVDLNEIKSSYPKPHRTALRNVTTHHPRRFPESFKQFKGKRALIFSRGHVSAMVDGVVEDWAINHSLRVYSLHIVEPI